MTLVKNRTDAVAASPRQLTKELRDEGGAILILALVYVIVISAMVASLTSWASNDLNNSTKFQSVNEIHYALSSAMNTALESERYSPIPTTPTASQYGGVATTLGQCWQPANGAAYQIPKRARWMDTLCPCGAQRK